MTQHEVKLACAFCGKSQRQVRKLIAGPTVYICDECIKLCNDILAEEKHKKREARDQPERENEKRAKESITFCCSFCGKTQREVRNLIAGPSVYICNECIGLCNDIIWEEIEREETAGTLRARLPGPVRAVVAEILERGMPAALRIRDVLRERILEDIDRRRRAGEGPDELLWVPDGLAADWADLHDILGRTTLREGEPGRGGSAEDELPGWVSPIVERLNGTLEVLGALARSLENPGLAEVRQLGRSVAVAAEKLREARGMLLNGPSRGRGESP